MGKWEEIKLDDGKITELIMGQSPPSKTYNTEKIGLPFFQGKKEFGELYPTVEKWCSKPNKIAEPGDVLLSVRAPVGPTNLAFEKCCIGRGLASIRPNTELLLTKFLLYYFHNFELDISAKGQGSTFKAISGKELRKLEIPLPPLPEQERIVAKLDGLFEKIDQAISLLEENIAHTEALMGSVLDEEFGKLDCESFVLKSISKKIQYGYTGKTKEKGKYYYLRITDIQDSQVDFDKAPFSDIPNEKVSKYILNKGDILFARTGATAGKSYLFNDDEQSIFASYLIRVVVDQNALSSPYLKWYFQSDDYWSQIFGKIVGAAQPNFNGKKLGELNIPVPNLEIQNSCVSKFEKYDEVIRGSIKTQTQKLNHLKALKSSLLDQAFKGEL